jgi:hypothetical protein
VSVLSQSSRVMTDGPYHFFLFFPIEQLLLTENALSHSRCQAFWMSEGVCAFADRGPSVMACEPYILLFIIMQ